MIFSQFAPDRLRDWNHLQRFLCWQTERSCVRLVAARRHSVRLLCWIATAQACSLFADVVL
ncbi:MAG TPA: hypothetical protein V6D18_02375 [Thermosynechococcaceae cyanobacterium]